MFAGCYDISNSCEPEANSEFSFLEYGMYTEADIGPLVMGDFGCYYFDRGNYSIKVYMPDDVQIDKSDKFIFGKHARSESSSLYALAIGDITESLTTQKSFCKVDTLTSPFSARSYEIKMIDCSSSGEAKILFNNKEITLKLKETFRDTLTYPDTILNIYGETYSLNFLRDIVIIENVGLIKKTAVY
jgi:hypothetical protein